MKATSTRLRCSRCHMRTTLVYQHQGERLCPPCYRGQSPLAARTPWAPRHAHGEPPPEFR